MKLRKVLPLLSVAVLSLTSCGKVKPWRDNIPNYVFSMVGEEGYYSGYNILQLTDIHWNYNTSAEANKRYLRKVVEEAYKHAGNKLDLVELTGDQFMLANSYHVKKFVEFFEELAEEFKFKYAIIWGNHDSHGLYNPNWLSRQFKKAKHALYKDRNDDLYGRSNFVINLYDKDPSYSDKVRWQIFNLDSGASFSDTAISPFRDYDYIRPEQTEWYVEEHKDYSGVPTIAYYHIPQDENQKAWDEIKAGATYKNKFFKLEGFGDNGTEKGASNFIDVAKDHDLKAAFMGHAHNVDWTVDYMGVTIGLGVKTGPELYYEHIDVNTTDPDMKAGLASLDDPITENFDLIGASLVTLNDISGGFTLEHLYYNERDTGDFVRWEKW